MVELQLPKLLAWVRFPSPAPPHRRRWIPRDPPPARFGRRRRRMIQLGWREWAVLPDLGLPRMRAKIDTGARTSALHVDAQWRFSEGGAPWVGFRVRCGKRQVRMLEAAAPLADEREVIDSGGHRGLRPFLRTTLWLAGEPRAVEI